MQLCPLGFTSSKDGRTCEACPSDKDGIIGAGPPFGDVVGARCEACAAGTPSTRPGTCPKGSGRASCDVDAKCLKCPPGTYAAASVKRAVDSCVPCARSTYSAAPGSTKCSPCAAGKALLGRGASSAASCNLTYAARAFKLRESVAVRASGFLGGDPFVENDDSTPRVIQVRSRCSSRHPRAR